MKELTLFREKYPIIPELNNRGEIVRGVEQIRLDTEESIKNNWGMHAKNRGWFLIRFKWNLIINSSLVLIVISRTAILYNIDIAINPYYVYFSNFKNR